MTKKIRYTHLGTIRGNACAPDGRKNLKVLLRETKMFWIGKYGAKYRKRGGIPLGQGDWPTYTLDVDSVKRLSVARILEE